MDLSAFVTSLQSTLGTTLPGIFGALGILIVGWLIAVLARAGTRRLLHAVKLNQHIKDSTEQAFDLERAISIGLFWLIILITLIGVFNALHLELISNPFQTVVAQILGYAPRFLAGVVLLLLAWAIAMILRAVVARALAATKWDEKLSEQAGMPPMTRSVANVLFWLVFVLFLPAILAAFDLTGLLEPVQGMINKTLDILPNVFAALVIGLVGWLLGKVLGGLVTNLLVAAGTDKLSDQLGVDKSVRLARLLGTLVFLLIFVPALVAALDALKVEAISRPATAMLNQILAAVPNIIAAALILVITFYVARFAANIMARLLNNMGFDSLPAKLGIKYAFQGMVSPSALVAKIILFFAMLFATVEAANKLEFTQLRDVLTSFITFGADVLLGALILVVGFWLSNIAYEAINRASGERSAVGQIARIAILGLVLAMGLRAMGIAPDIVNLAFGLTLGAVAVSVALAFGLGGREAAGKQMEYWLRKWRKED